MRYFFIIICLLLLFAGCEQKITDAFAYSGILSVSEENMKFGASAHSKSMQIKGVTEWDVDSAGMESWCTLLPVHDYNGREFITVWVDSNEMLPDRETVFRITSGTQRVAVTVSQLGNIPQILFSSDSLQIGRDTNLLKIRMVTNIEYEMSYDADWFSVQDEEFEGDRRMLVHVSPNLTGADRRGVISFKHKDGEESWTWPFVQLTSEPPYVPQGVEELQPNRKVLPVSAEASTESENKGIDKSYDNNRISYFQSRYQQAGEPVVLEYHFDGTMPIHYICYVPYEGDQQKSFKDTEIWVKEEGGEYRMEKKHSFSKSGDQTLVLGQPLEKPAAVKFVVLNTHSSEKSTISACAEMEFYSAQKRFENVFGDMVYGSLQRSVSLDDIFAIEDPLFNGIAYHLYHRNYETGRIAVYPAYPEVAQGYKTFTGSYGNLDNVTGILVKAGETVPVFADGIGQKQVSLTVFNPAKPREMRHYRLYDGVNKITMDYDGYLYLSYHEKTVDEVTVHIAGGRYVGFIDARKPLEDQEYDFTDAEYVNVLGTHSHLIFKRESLENKDLASLVARYDEIVRSQQVFMGLEKYGEKIRNRVLFLETPDKFNIMYSKRNYVECPSIDMKYLTDASLLKEEKFWNLALAVGYIHNHNMMNWKGITHTTPKLFALASQKALGEPLEVDAGDWYAEAFGSILVPEEKLANVPDDCYEHPEKIVPFWQLYLYASEILGKKDYYMDVLKNSRMFNFAAEGMFVQQLQNVMKMDLTQFFSRWGFSYTARNRFPKAPGGLIYLTPNNVGKFKNPGKPSAMGCVYSKGVVTVMGPQNAVAFLVRHSYVPTQVSDKPVFKVSEWKPSMKVFAVGADGEEVEIRRFN